MKKTPQAGQPNGVRKTDYGVIMANTEGLRPGFDRSLLLSKEELL